MPEPQRDSRETKLRAAQRREVGFLSAAPESSLLQRASGEFERDQVSFLLPDFPGAAVLCWVLLETEVMQECMSLLKGPSPGTRDNHELMFISLLIHHLAFIQSVKKGFLLLESSISLARLV